MVLLLKALNKVMDGIIHILKEVKEWLGA